MIIHSLDPMHLSISSNGSNLAAIFLPFPGFFSYSYGEVNTDRFKGADVPALAAAPALWRAGVT